MLPTLNIGLLSFFLFALFPQGSKKEGKWLLGLIVWITRCMYRTAELSSMACFLHGTLLAANFLSKK